MPDEKKSPPTGRGLPANAVYPVILTQMENAPVVVVGGGSVGERKVKGLLAVGAAVRLISPTVTPQLQGWAEAALLDWQARPYQGPQDLAGMRLVFAATDRRDVNAQVARDAANLRLLCNVADAPAEGNFFVPAVYRTEAVLVAVSTAGKSPTQARRLRDAIAGWLKRQR